MKNLFKVFGIIALTAIIGFGFVACGPGAGTEDVAEFPADLIGIWEDTTNSSTTLTFDTWGVKHSGASDRLRLESKNGDQYTMENSYGASYTLTMTVAGDTLTVSGAASEIDYYNGTYTKK